MSDFLGIVYTVTFVLVFLLFSELLAKFNHISKENARKIIHISVGNVVFFIPMFDTRWIAAAIPAIFVVGNFLLSPLSPIKKLQLRTFTAGHKWGTILYPLSLSIVTYLGFSHLWIIVASFFPVVYGDGFAAIFGPLAKKGIFKTTGGVKTLLGTSVMAVLTWVSVLLGIVILGYDLSFAIITASVACILVVPIELLSPKGMDNLFIPIILYPIFQSLENMMDIIGDNLNLTIYLIGVIFGLIFAVGGYFGKALTVDGALSGFLITTFMLGIGGYVIGIQLLLFFVIGSLATKFVKKIAGKTQAEFEKGGEQRDAIQAIAKAGLASILSLFYLHSHHEFWLFVITGLMSAAIVDTLATEVGIAFKGTPRSVFRPWKLAKRGDAGVISIYGTIGGLFFGSVLTVSVYLVSLVDPVYHNFASSNSMLIILPLIGGLIGMITDSMIGATIQRRNKCIICGEVVEANTHHEQTTMHCRGIYWFNNDLTNISGTLAGGLSTLLLVLLIL